MLQEIIKALRRLVGVHVSDTTCWCFSSFVRSEESLEEFAASDAVAAEVGVRGVVEITGSVSDYCGETRRNSE